MKLHAGIIAKQLRQDKSRIQQSAAAEPHSLVNAVLYVVGIPGAEIVDAIQFIHSIFFQPTEAQVDGQGIRLRMGHHQIQQCLAAVLCGKLPCREICVFCRVGQPVIIAGTDQVVQPLEPLDLVFHCSALGAL